MSRKPFQIEALISKINVLAHHETKRLEERYAGDLEWLQLKEANVSGILERSRERYIKKLRRANRKAKPRPGQENKVPSQNKNEQNIKTAEKELDRAPKVKATRKKARGRRTRHTRARSAPKVILENVEVDPLPAIEEDDEPELVPSLLRVVDLRRELKKRGLPTGGRKAVLIARLEAALEDDHDLSGGKADDQTAKDAQVAREAEDEVDAEKKAAEEAEEKRLKEEAECERQRAEKEYVRKKAEDERKRKEAEEDERKRKESEKREAAEEEERQRKEDFRKQAEFEARKKREADAERRRKEVEEEERRLEEERLMRKKAEEKARLKAKEEQRRRREDRERRKREAQKRREEDKRREEERRRQEQEHLEQQKREMEKKKRIREEILRKAREERRRAEQRRIDAEEEKRHIEEIKKKAAEEAKKKAEIERQMREEEERREEERREAIRKEAERRELERREAQRKKEAARRREVERRLKEREEAALKEEETLQLALKKKKRAEEQKRKVQMQIDNALNTQRRSSASQSSQGSRTTRSTADMARKVKSIMAMGFTGKRRIMEALKISNMRVRKAVAILTEKKNDSNEAGGRPTSSKSNKSVKSSAQNSSSTISSDHSIDSQQSQESQSILNQGSQSLLSKVSSGISNLLRWRRPEQNQPRPTPANNRVFQKPAPVRKKHKLDGSSGDMSTKIRAGQKRKGAAEGTTPPAKRHSSRESFRSISSTSTTNSNGTKDRKAPLAKTTTGLSKLRKPTTLKSAKSKQNDIILERQKRQEKIRQRQLEAGKRRLARQQEKERKLKKNLLEKDKRARILQQQRIKEAAKTRARLEQERKRKHLGLKSKKESTKSSQACHTSPPPKSRETGPIHKLTPPNRYPSTYEMTDREGDSSDYSDRESPSKDRIPLWAQKGNVRVRLKAQAQVNSDEIFGDIRGLKLDLGAIFKGFTHRSKVKRFGNRNLGSGDWTPDRNRVMN